MTDRQELMSQVFHSYQLNPRIKSINVNKFHPKDIRNKNYLLSHMYAVKGVNMFYRKRGAPESSEAPTATSARQTALPCSIWLLEHYYFF